MLLAGADGQALGGGVAGVLTAASAVQVLLHDFVLSYFHVWYSGTGIFFSYVVFVIVSYFPWYSECMSSCLTFICCRLL